MPVDMIIGFPARATRAINGRSTSSNEAILYAGAPRRSRRPTALSSNGLEKSITPSSRARANSVSCHSNGVCASL
jgi:hypothetical protein